MSLFQVILILRARSKIIAIIFAITFFAALITAALIPKTYKATTTLIFSHKVEGPLTGNTTLDQSNSGHLPTDLSTQIDIIKSPAVALQVIDKLKLNQPPLLHKVDQDITYNKADKTALSEWISGKLLKNLEVAPSTGSRIINLTFANADPNLAAMVANTFADEYRKLNIELELGPSRSALIYFNEQLQTANTALEAALKKMSQFQEKNGMASSNYRFDVETMRLNELSDQLIKVQSQLMEASSSRNQVRGSKDEAKLNTDTQKFTPEHPSLTAQAKINSIRSELQSEVAIAPKTVSNNADILSQRESELRMGVSEQKAKVLNLNRKRVELSMLSKEVETAQRTYDAISQRLAQIRFQGQSNQSDVAVLTVAAVPKQAASPAMASMLLVAAFAGIILGVSVALACELGSRRIHSARDLEQIMGLPVLVTLEPIGTIRFLLEGKQ